MESELLVTPLYAGIFALMLLVLSAIVISKRRRHNIPLLHGDHPEIMRAIRAHGNFTEYVPFALFLMLLIELNGAPRLFMHAVGLTLLAGRFLHAYGILVLENKSKEEAKTSFTGRVVGMVLTFSALALTACFAIYQFIGHELGYNSVAVVY
ncbi:glutathione metabolism protein [bacterium]|nr:glutathione metabolism protein [bacterium]